MVCLAVLLERKRSRESARSANPRTPKRRESEANTQNEHESTTTRTRDNKQADAKRGIRKGVAQMAWEDRNGKYYYYRKRRQGEHVVSEYVGSGFLGAFAEDLDRAERVESEQARAGLKFQKEEAAAMDQQIFQLESSVNTLARAVLLVSGYHPHKRQWRKQRNG